MAGNYGIDEFFGDIYNGITGGGGKNSGEVRIEFKQSTGKPRSQSPGQAPKPQAVAPTNQPQERARIRAPFPEDFRAPLYDQLDSEMERKHGLPAGLLKTIRTKGEMSNASQVSKKGARGPYQFIESTRNSFIKNHGIDPWASPSQQVEAAAIHLKEDFNRYGSWAKAVAGYNGGERGVRNPAKETRDYVARVSAAMGWSPTAINQPGNNQVNDWLASAVPDAVKATNPSGLSGSQSSAIFGQGVQDLDTRRAALEGEMDKSLEGISVLDAAIQAAQADDRVQREQQVQETRQINETLTAGNRALLAQAQPLFEARNRVADQLAQNATMNPIEKALRGIFDSNYDDDFLKEQLGTFQTILDAKGYNYDYMNKLSADAVKLIDQRYGLNMSDSMLDVLQATEDLGIAEKRLSVMNQLMNSSQENLGVQSQLIVAQKNARQFVLEQADDATLQEQMSIANQNKGPVTYGGATFSANEIRDELRSREQQDIAVRSHQLAIAQGEMQLADALAKDIAFRATRAELDAAQTNGGMIRGVQVPQDILNAATQNARQMAEGEARDILMRMPQNAAFQQLGSLSNISTQLYTRSRDILGTEGRASLAPGMRQIADSHTQIMQKVNEGAAPEVISALMDRHAKLVQGISDTVDSRILTLTNGDKVLAGAIGNFVRGIPMTEGASIEVLTRAAIKGSLPNGLSLGPEARSVFKAAQDLVAANRNDAKGNPRSEKDLASIVTDQLGPRIRALSGNPRLSRVVANLPAYAKEQNNPLGRLKPEWWRRTLDQAQSTALTRMADQISRTGTIVTVTDIQQIMAGKFTDNSPAGQAKVKAVRSNSGMYTAAETQVIVQRLESIQPLTPETTNSELYEDFLASPGLTNRLNKEEGIVRANSFGDYLLGPLSQGATASVLSQYRADVGKVNRARDDQGYEDTQIDRSIFQSSRGRLLVMAQAIPGIGNTGANKLLPIIAQKTGTNTSLSTDLEFINWLAVQKFEDPELQGYAKRFVHEYPEISKWIPEIHKVIAQRRGEVRGHLSGGR